MELLHGLGHSLLLAAGMFWTVLWALVFGFTRSAMVRVLLQKNKAVRVFGGQGLREIALVAAWGVGSFAPSYAAVAMARTLFKKGSSLLCALVFLFASTNLSTEFLLILWLLMGWRVMLLEIVGGLACIALLCLIVRTGWRKSWDDTARARLQNAPDSEEATAADIQGETLREKITCFENWTLVADGFLGGWRRAGLELVMGFVLAGTLTVFVPGRWWHVLSTPHLSAGVSVAEHVLVGPLVAAFTCIPSLGNLALARVLLTERFGIAGVLAFLYADLLALPLVWIYRRNFGTKAAAFIVIALGVSAAGGGFAAWAFAKAVHLAARITPPPSLLAWVSGQWRLPTLPNIAALLVTVALVTVHLYAIRHEAQKPNSQPKRA